MPEPTPQVPGLWTLPLVQRLAPTQQRELGLAGRWVRFSAGETVVEAGFRSEALWFLPDASVRVGDRTVPRAPRGGLVVGEAALFGPTRWRESVTATEDLRAWRFDPQALPADHPAMQRLKLEVLAGLSEALAAVASGVVEAPADRGAPRARRPPSRTALQRMRGPAGARGLFRGERGPTLSEVEERRFDSRLRLALRSGVALVLAGGVERSSGGRHAETLGVGAWVGLVPRFAPNAPSQVFTARPGAHVLIVPSASVPRLLLARTDAGERFLDLAGRRLIDRLDVARLRGTHARLLAAPPREPGVPAAVQTTALSASSRGAGTADPILDARCG